MSRFTLPSDIYFGENAMEELKNLKGHKRAFVVTGGHSMQKFGFLEKLENILRGAGMEVRLFEGVEPDPSVETVMKGAAAMREFGPDVIVAIGGGSPIDAAKAMWVFYEYPEKKFDDIKDPFTMPKLRTKAIFAAIPSTSGTASEVTALGNLAVNGLSLTPWQRVTAVRVCVLVRTVGGNTRIADKTGAARTYKNCQDADTAQPARDTITRYVQVFGLRNGLKQYY